MAALLRARLGVAAELIPSSGGVFEVRADGRLAFSKKTTGRFPTDEEVLAALQAPR